MKFKIDTPIEFEFSANDSIPLEKAEAVKKIPERQGVYVLHKNAIEQAWYYKEQIFYIGAADKQGLRERARHHRIALLCEKDSQGKPKFGPQAMNDYGATLNGDLRGVYFSYYSFSEKVQANLPFLLEAYLLYYYFEKFGENPKVNKGH